jgi:hypothetical protein
MARALTARYRRPHREALSLAIISTSVASHTMRAALSASLICPRLDTLLSRSRVSTAASSDDDIADALRI